MFVSCRWLWLKVTTQSSEQSKLSERKTQKVTPKTEISYLGSNLQDATIRALNQRIHKKQTNKRREITTIQVSFPKRNYPQRSQIHGNKAIARVM